MRTLLLVILLMVIAALIYLATQRDGPSEGPTETPPVVTPDTTDDAPEDVGDSRALPRFDIVRVDRQGFAQIAGRAAPSAEVEVLANGELLVTETALPNGDWATFTETPLPGGPVELSLKMTTTDGLVVIGAETVIIYVPEREGDLPIVLRTTPGGRTEVLQRATDPDPSLGPLTIETIDYDAGGNVIFAGRAEPNRIVQVFADRQPVGQTTADPAGRWELSTTIAPGRYTLLIVQLDAEGKPAYAIEVPFEQASAEDIRIEDGKVIVQPGNNLWVISRRVYGEGEQYTIIFEANKDQIRDPDLIYPGQVFRLPEEGEEEDGAAEADPETDTGDEK